MTKEYLYVGHYEDIDNYPQGRHYQRSRKAKEGTHEEL